jgi:hypothetical protein
MRRYRGYAVESPIPVADRVPIYKAIISNDIAFIVQHVATPGYTRERVPLPRSPEIPELLHYGPTPLSIAAYTGATESFSYLIVNGAHVEDGDFVSFPLITMPFFI